jgi:molybdopterin/thiamine biosynthesis adenylyltransferase
MTAAGPFSRYHRQMLLPELGEAGQRMLRDSAVLIVGCGALGSAAAEFLVRAGVGEIHLVDRDLVEPTNLQRQLLYGEADAARSAPKAEAARARLESINREVRVRAWVDDLSAENAREYADGADLIVDGLDNFETRYLLNDLAVECGIPYCYGGAVGTAGMAMTILPRRSLDAPSSRRRARRELYPQTAATPCLRCLFPEPPPPGSLPTCDTAGVLGTVTAAVAALQATDAIKLLSGNHARIGRGIRAFDLWGNADRFSAIAHGPDEGCGCCGLRRFEHLDGVVSSAAAVLCGRNAVQIRPAARGRIDLDALAGRLAAHGAFGRAGELVRGRFASEHGEAGDPIELTVFADGRAIVVGSTEPERARAVYAKYIGA